jgi:integrase
VTVIARAPRPASVGVTKRAGRYVVSVRVQEQSGRRRYRQKFERRADADAQANAIRARIRAGLPPFQTAEAAAPAVVTVLDVLLYYPKTIRGDEHINAIKKTALAGKPAEGFGLADLDGYIKEREGLKTCSKDFSFLKRACAYAKAHGVIGRHEFERLAGDKVTRRRLMPAYVIADSPGKEIPDTDLEKIFGKLAPDAQRAVLFARATGSRLGEVASLDWQEHWSPEVFRPIVQKRCRPRVVTCDPAIVGPRGIGFVFAELGATRKAIARRLQSCWRYAVKAAKVPHYRFHDLRHTYGTRLRRDGKTYSDIAAIMGITEAMAHVYAHEDTERIQREAIEPGTIRSLLALAKLA